MRTRAPAAAGALCHALTETGFPAANEPPTMASAHPSTKNPDHDGRRAASFGFYAEASKKSDEEGLVLPALLVLMPLAMVLSSGFGTRLTLKPETAVFRQHECGPRRVAAMYGGRCPTVAVACVVGVRCGAGLRKGPVGSIR